MLTSIPTRSFGNSSKGVSAAACPGMAELAQAILDELLDPAPRLLDVVRVEAGLFKGCTGVVRDVEPGDAGLVTVSVFVADQERWTEQPYADSDLTVTARFVDDAYYAMPAQAPAIHS
jgi:hypothetical protein